MTADASAAARDAGTAFAILPLTWEEREDIRSAIFATARAVPEFTSDQVWDHMGDVARCALERRPNALGALIRGASLFGAFEPTGRMTKSARVSAHRRNLPIWKSNLFREAL